MMKQIVRTLPVLLAFVTAGVHAQFYKLHGGSVSVGGTGQFSTILTSSPSNQTETSAVIPGNFRTTTVSNQQQYTTGSVGFVTKLQFHPLPWAGMELNYGYTHYSERFVYNTANNSGGAGVVQVNAPTGWHEFSAAYLVHPKFIPLQPYFGVGGGAIDFNSSDNQWRGAGLVETGIDIPVKKTHAGFRLGARGLFYRTPDFRSQILSTNGWRVTAEPEISSYYRF